MSRVVRIVCMAVFAAAALVSIIERAGTDPVRVAPKSDAHVEATAPRSWESANDASGPFTTVRGRDLFLSGNCMACHPMSGGGARQLRA